MQAIKEFFAPSVAGALSQFQKAADNLDRVIQHHSAKEAKHLVTVAKAQTRAEAARDEADHASNVRNKFASVFGI